MYLCIKIETNIIKNMEVRINLRGTMASLKVGERLEVERKPFNPNGFAPDYVRSIATKVGDNEGKFFSVSARKGERKITVTRIS